MCSTGKSTKARESLLARVEERVDQICFDVNISAEHVRDETVRERTVIVP